jgi:hypothetical protein
MKPKINHQETCECGGIAEPVRWENDRTLVLKCNSCKDEFEATLERKTKKFKVTFLDELEAETEEEAYDIFLGYLAECVKAGDVMAFDFKEIKGGVK